MFKTKVMLLILALCLASVHSDARADEVNYSAAYFFAGGLLLTDIGASVANGIALATGRPNRLNGYFGVVAGAVSLGLVAINYAATDDKDLRDDFALVFGTAGTASLAIGIVTVRRAPRAGERSEETKVRIFPYLAMESDRRYRMGVGARMTF